MKKLFTASVLLLALVALQAKSFALDFECQIQDGSIESIQSVELKEDELVINKNNLIPLSRTKIKCGNFGRQTRLDGEALGYMVILKTCSTEAHWEGDLIDSVKKVAATVRCNPVQ